MNLMVDFVLHRYEAGPQKGQDSLWAFRFGKCDEFQRAIQGLKRIPLDQRFYHKEKNHLWEVAPSPTNERLLSQLFDNFKTCLEAARRQLILPGMEGL